MTSSVYRFDVYDRMRKSLRHSGMNTGQIADAMGISRETVSRWLNGSRSVPEPGMRLWAFTTGVTYEWLTEGIEPADSQSEGLGFESLRAHNSQAA